MCEFDADQRNLSHPGRAERQGRGGDAGDPRVILGLVPRIFWLSVIVRSGRTMTAV
jgi:hypothetical protein